MRLDVAFVRLALRVDGARLASEVETVPPGSWRAHPEGAPGNTAVPLIAAHGNPHDDATVGPMRPTPELRRLPYLQQVLASLGAPIGRTRLMSIAAEGELGVHADTNRYWQDHLRVHVPLVTDPSVRFTCGDQEVHMAVGEAWVFDTWLRHGVRNPAGIARVHLVVDTVGSSVLWSRIDAGARHGFAGSAIGDIVAVGADELLLESFNSSRVASPWEQATHADRLLLDLGEDADDGYRRCLRAFVADWRALWATHGDGPDGAAAYRRLRDRLDRQLDALPKFVLPNGTVAAEAIRQLLIRPAASPTGLPPPPRRRRGRVDRPVFVVSPPRSGSSMLFEALARASEAHTIRGESHEVFEGIEALHPASRGWTSNALGPDDAVPEVVDRLEAAFRARALDRDDRPPAGSPIRLIEKTPKNALRVRFLAAAFPDASFVYLHRAALPTVSSMLDAWRSGRFVTYPSLPGWPGPPWSLLLVPGWQALAGRPLAEIVARQWAITVSTLLDDLETIDPGRLCVADYDLLRSEPDAELQRVCDAVGLTWDRRIVGALPLSRTTLDAPDEDKWRRNAVALGPYDAELEPVAARAGALASTVRTRHANSGSLLGSGRPPRPQASGGAATAYTGSFPELLGRTHCSVAVTTGPAGRVVLLSSDPDGRLRARARRLSRPTGIAFTRDLLSIATDQAVWEFRNQPAVAHRLPPAGRHDACFIPRAAHVTGAIGAAELTWVGGQLWLANSRFSCLATLDASHSFVPMWRPPFVSALAPEDRCHLNGLAVVDGQPRFVTALAMSDERSGWRRDRLGGGVLIDVDSGGIVAYGLTLPHSPRCHRDRLWVLESGRGELSVVDVAAGTVEPVVALPGFTRGLAFLGRYALVGVSKVRTHGQDDLPIEADRSNPSCGIWIVDLETASTAGFMRFTDAVDEILDVQIVPGARFPELVEPGDPVAGSAFVVPDGPAVVANG